MYRLRCINSATSDTIHGATDNADTAHKNRNEIEQSPDLSKSHPEMNHQEIVIDVWLKWHRQLKQNDSLFSGPVKGTI